MCTRSLNRSCSRFTFDNIATRTKVEAKALAERRRQIEREGPVGPVPEATPTRNVFGGTSTCTCVNRTSVRARTPVALHISRKDAPLLIIVLSILSWRMCGKHPHFLPFSRTPINRYLPSVYVSFGTRGQYAVKRNRSETVPSLPLTECSDTFIFRFVRHANENIPIITTVLFKYNIVNI